jgi:transcription elongation factor Elf1
MSEKLQNPDAAEGQGGKEKQPAYVTLPQISGSEGQVSVSFLNATFQKKGHVRTYPDPAFGSWLVDEIYNHRKLFAVKKGVLKKSFTCPACNSRLVQASASRRSIEYELQYRGLPPFTLRIDILAAECPQCGKVSVIDARGRLVYSLNEAMIHAFEAGKVKP